MPSQVMVVVGLSTAVSIMGRLRTGILRAGMVECDNLKMISVYSIMQLRRTTHFDDLLDHDDPIPTSVL
jgi:hypothetical protein